VVIRPAEFRRNGSHAPVRARVRPARRRPARTPDLVTLRGPRRLTFRSWDETRRQQPPPVLCSRPVTEKNLPAPLTCVASCRGGEPDAHTARPRERRARLGSARRLPTNHSSRLARRGGVAGLPSPPATTRGRARTLVPCGFGAGDAAGFGSGCRVGSRGLRRREVHGCGGCGRGGEGGAPLPDGRFGRRPGPGVRPSALRLRRSGWGTPHSRTRSSRAGCFDF